MMRHNKSSTTTSVFQHTPFFVFSTCKLNTLPLARRQEHRTPGTSGVFCGIMCENTKYIHTTPPRPVNNSRAAASHATKHVTSHTDEHQAQYSYQLWRTQRIMHVFRHTRTCKLPTNPSGLLCFGNPGISMPSSACGPSCPPKPGTEKLIPVSGGDRNLIRCNKNQLHHPEFEGSGGRQASGWKSCGQL